MGKAALGLMLTGLIVWAVLPAGGGEKVSDRMSAPEPIDNSCADPSGCGEVNQEAHAKQSVAPKAALPAASAAIASGWRYTVEKDELRGTTRKVAYLDSPERLDFQFPYSGGTTATLYVSRRGSAKPVIGLKVDKGQFICSITGDTVIHVKFGDRPVEPFGCFVASDGSSDVIFMSHADLFLARMRKAKTLMIEAPFYREGVRQIRFDTAGLDLK